VSPAIRQAMKL